MTMSPRPSIRPGLLTHRLDDQLMVYDRTDDQIHLLDGTTATVFGLLAQGVSADAIASKLDALQTVAPGAKLLEIALGDLARARLIENEPRNAAPVARGRREVLQKLAGAGAALLIPAIVTLTPSRAYAQTSQGQIGAICTRNSECVNGCCGKNSTGNCITNTCVDPNTCACDNQG